MICDGEKLVYCRCYGGLNLVLPQQTTAYIFVESAVFWSKFANSKNIKKTRFFLQMRL